MSWLPILAAPLLTLACLYFLWKALRMFRTWAPAAATVWRSDYSEIDRIDDAWHSTPFGTARGWELGDSEDSRLINDLVLFTDADGHSIRTNIERRVARGWRPDSVFTIWYDPTDPHRATVHGPGSWLGLALVCAATLAALFALGAGLLTLPS